MKRTGKFYYKNEKEVLSRLGLAPAPQSGAGWIVKEDGENELVMVQLKSTDNSSYKLDMLDIKKLEYHAQVSNKVPIFLIQFLRQDKIYAVVDIANINDLYNAFELKEAPKRMQIGNDANIIKDAKIKASKNSRDKFYREQENKFSSKSKRR